MSHSVSRCCGAASEPAAVWIGQRSWVGLRSAARFGDLSFGIYLWSYPVKQVTRLWLDPHLPMALQLAVVLAQAVAIAWLSYRLIEAPALRLKPGRAASVTRPAVEAGGRSSGPAVIGAAA